MAKNEFASEGDTKDKAIAFTEIGRGLYAFTAEGDPNTGVIIGDDSVAIVDAQATPDLGEKVVEKVRSVTDKPISHVVLTHYHAVRTLGASAYGDCQIVSSDLTRQLIVERGQEDWDSELARFPRLFRGAGSIPGLTWPTVTFASAASIWLGEREVRLMHLGRGHTMGDIAAWVGDERTMFTGDLVEYESACYCGDAHFQDWSRTLDRVASFQCAKLVPGRGAALTNSRQVSSAIESTRDFLTTLFGTVNAGAEANMSLYETYEAVREVMDPRFGDYAIYDHCMPFNVARAYDEARGQDRPRVWTAARDRELWAELAEGGARSDAVG